MKKTFLFICIVMLSSQLFSQTLFTYGNKSVSKSEFVKAYEKNPSADTTNRKQALRNYLDLYIAYKLKVQAAYDEKLNETDEYKSEAQNFKRELAETAINNEADINSLMQQAVERSKTDIQLSQIFLPASANSDTIKAAQAIDDAYRLLKEGKSFTDVLQQVSNDSAALKTNGNIGNITVFTLPYEAENLVYNLQPGQFSKPYHSRIGYHIFKVVSKRPAVGSRKVQLILFALSPLATEAQVTAAKKEADSVYHLLQSGASFDNLRAMFTSKKSTDNTIDVRVGEYSTDFENGVFSLEKDGDISKPFRTAYGYNIVKLIKKESALVDTNDITVKARLQEKVAADDRLTIAREALHNKWLLLSGYKMAPYQTTDLWKFTDSAVSNGSSNLTIQHVNENTVLFTFQKKKILVSDWIRFVQMKWQEGKSKPNYGKLMPQFVSYAVTNYYKDHIEEYHPELASQIADFNDANLLFAAMDKHVWSKAASDTTGLLQYFNAHKKEYTWAPGADAIVVSANNKEIATEIAQKIKAKPTQWREIVATYGSSAQADSTRFENDQLQIADTNNLKSGYTTEPTPINDGAQYTFTYIVSVHKESGQRSFNEARGIVLNDYQGIVEKKWLESIKNKYPVKINEAVFKTI